MTYSIGGKDLYTEAELKQAKDEATAVAIEAAARHVECMRFYSSMDKQRSTLQIAADEIRSLATPSGTANVPGELRQPQLDVGVKFRDLSDLEQRGVELAHAVKEMEEGDCGHSVPEYIEEMADLVISTRNLVNATATANPVRVEQREVVRPIVHEARPDCPTRHQELAKDVSDSGELRYRCQGCGCLFAPIGELRNALVHAEQAMQSAWYELGPGHCVIGDQFIKKDDMMQVLKLVRATLKAEGAGSPPPGVTPIEREAVERANAASGTYIVHFDDADRQMEVFTGEGAWDAAMRFYKQSCTSWNCRLFVMAYASPAIRAAAPKSEDAK